MHCAFNFDHVPYDHQKYLLLGILASLAVHLPKKWNGEMGW